MVTLFVDDLDGFGESAAVRASIRRRGRHTGNGVCKATYRDADGNEVAIGGARSGRAGEGTVAMQWPAAG